MAISDEVIRKNRQYLTQAQIDALVAAEKQFNNQNAGNRAGALATAREQYDTGYRGLQNMGLAGASGAAPASGEVPRLQQQIRTPFEDYNNRLRDVERQRLGALGDQFAQQTQAAWAAEAERQRQAQEAAARARAAAAVVAANIRVSAAVKGAEEAVRQAQINAINAKGMKQTAQVKQQAFENGIGSLLSPAEKAQRDGMLRTARPQDVAAAAAFNIAHYAQATVAERANADQERGIKLTEKIKGSADSSNANKYYNGPNNTAFSQSEADAEYKSAQQTLDNLKLKQHYGGKVSEEEMTAAQNAALIAKVKAEDPEYYSAINTVNSTTATPDAKRKANMVIADRSTTEAVNAMGYKSTMSSAQFDDVSKVIPDLRMQLNIIDSTRNRMSNGGTGGKKTIDEAIAELEKHGYTEQETRELVKQFDDERYFRREYDYLNNAYTALYEHQGEKPEKPLNSKEMNPTYWAVNGNVDAEGKTLRNIGKSSTKAIAMRVEEFMTQEQRDAYNAIYEKDGIKAANAYAQAIKPFLEMQAAEADRKYFEEFASDESWLKRFQAWAFARGSNLLGSVPAMAEKLIVNGQNIVQEGKTNGTGVLKKYSPDSNISRMSNWADIVQTKQSQDILEKYDKQNRPGMGKFVNFMYNTGTSMADSMIAMGVSGALGSWATDVLFFSSAGNQAYKDAIARGATQEQAMGLAFLSGTAEALFEHISLDRLTKTLSFKGKPLIQALKETPIQTFVEGSEEFLTEFANILSDFAIMKGKSGMQQAIDNGELGRFLLDRLGSAAVGGFASGFLFGLAGVGGTAVSAAKDSRAKSKIGNRVRENSNVQQVKNTAILLGGEAMQQAEQVQKHETDANVGEMTVTVLNEIQSLGKELDQDQQVGLTRVLDGSEMTAEEAKDVHELLGRETLEKFSYDAATPEAFQKSYNKRLQEHNVTSREETMQKASEERFAKQKKDAASRVWANPEQGLSLTTPEGNTIMPMPGNLRAVEQAEQERAGFKTRATATKGNVTYAVAGMEARQGMSNEQTYSEIQKGLTKEARQKAQLYEKLASALGVKMIVHDVMTGTNGFIDEKGNMHVVLSGKQSVLRVAAHELTHLMKENAGNEYASMRDHLISEVGQEKFDRMTKQKANEYGIDLSTEKGKILADDEVCAELCERMLSNEDALEKFAEKDTTAAKTLKEHLLKILNAIKAAFKRAENRDFGESWSDLIKSQDTIESWITGLQKAIDNAGKKTAEKTDAMRGDLFLSEEDEARAERKKQAEANAEKGTYVRGISAKEMDSVLSNVMVGDKSNYEGDDYEHSRAMIAQLVPEVIDALNGEANLDDVQAKLETAVGEMVDNYFEEYGDGLPNLRSKIDATIGINDQAKGEIKYSEKNMRKVANEISHALGKRVTLVGETNPKFKTAQKLDSLWEAMNEDEVIDQKYNWSTDVNKLVDFINDQAADRVKLTGKERENTIYAQVGEMISAVSDMLSEKTGKRYSFDTDYMRLAEKQKNGTLTKEDESKLRKMVNEAAKAAGYDLRAYHGTPNGTFNTFRSWQYFTTNKEYANLYQGQGASSNGYKKTATNRRTYDTFIKMEKPFDTRNAAERKIFMNEFYRQWGNGAPLSDRGLPDWTDGDDLIEFFEDKGYDYDGILLDEGGVGGYGEDVKDRGISYVIKDSSQIKSADPVTYDDQGNIIPLSERFRTDRTGDESWKNQDIRYSIDTDAIRQAFTVIDTAGIEDGLEALKDVKHVGSFALKDITRFLDASAGKNKDLRNTLHAIFEAPHSEATGRYAQGVERMQQKVLDIGKRAGVCDEKGKHFDSKKSAAIQNIGEGFSNTYTDLKLKVKDADHVTVRAYEPGTDNLVDSEKDYTLKELRQAYGTNAADYVWSRVFDETQKAQETGGKPGWVDEKVNTRPYTIDDLQTAYPNDWQKLKAAADEFRQMYDEYIRDQNNMLATIYPIESEYADVEKLDAGIEKKQERLAQHKAAVETQIENLQKSLEAKEKEIASKKRTDTNAYRQLVEQANKLTSRIAEVKAEIAEYEANAKDELMKMNVLKAEMQNAVQKGDYSLKRMHRLQYRSDYFHHFTEMASGIQNLKSIFTNNTDIAPAIVGKSENTKAKTKWAGYFQQRMGGDYTADALNGMLRYGQLAEYKLAFDPLTAYLRDVNKQIRNMSSDTNRDGLIRYIDQWADNIAGKSHKLDRVVSDSGMAPRKAMQVLQWINSRVIQNTLLFNMRSALVQISNITNAKGIVKNNIDWVNGLKAWALAANGDEAMASIMSQSNFLASRYMDGLALTDSKLKSAKQFAGWMLGALDEVSAKATWWAAYQQYTRNPNAAKNQYRNYEDAIDYADDITRRTHAGRGVGELAPAMTSRVINFVAPFQVEVNNTWQLLKDNVKQKNYLGLLSTGLSVFLFNTFFEAIVGSTPLGFDFIRAVMDIALGFLNDDPDDDPDAKEIGQRFAGELVGGLPFASQLVAAFGEDNAKKLLGENNDATRYGNTQIGVSAVVNAAKGLKDIGTGLIEGRRVNWLDDLDDLMNLTLPMGAKQLTRTAQGLATVAKGYAGKYDKEGNEKVQFVTDQDVLHYIHAGLFGKWALTEASEYFGEKRLLPQLFGKYNGPKSSIGNMVDAKEYKAALKTGIDGKQYFNLKYDLKKYTTQAGKRAEMAEQPFTAEQKAQLDALMIVDSKKESKTNGAVVYQKNNDGEWDVKADYSSSEWLEVAELGTKQYDLAKESGVKPAQYMQIYSVWKSLSGNDKKDQAREYLNSLHLTKEQYDYIWTNVFKYKAE